MERQSLGLGPASGAPNPAAQEHCACMGRHGKRPGPEVPTVEPVTPRRLPDGVASVFVEAQQQQGVPSGVHPAGADVLRRFHELQRLASAGSEASTVPTRAPERAGAPVAGLGYRRPVLDTNP